MFGSGTHRPKKTRTTPEFVFGRRVSEARKTALLTQAALAERLKKLGRPISRAKLAKIETGEQTVRLDDVFAIAEALELPPVYLLAPRDDERDIEITATVTITPAEMRAWARGYPRQGHDNLEHLLAQLPRDEARAVFESLLDSGSTPTERLARQLVSDTPESTQRSATRAQMINDLVDDLRNPIREEENG
jgi:transcriptional regulator with XRE-family HTH domain